MWGGGVLLWWQPEVDDICGEEEYYYGGNERLRAYVGSVKHQKANDKIYLQTA